MLRRIGRRIRAAREHAGMTQEDMAPLLGFNRGQSIHRWEKGEMIVSALDIIKLADITGRPASWFLEGETSQWPRTLNEWIALSGGDETRAAAHYDLDQRFKL